MHRLIYNQKFIRYFFQSLILIGLALFLWKIGYNLFANMQAKGLQFGLSFLYETAGFGVSQTLIEYSESSSFGRLYFVGLLNTLLVAVIGIILATFLGFIIALARLSQNPVIRYIGSTYVEITRNLPALFQILFCYVILLNILPKGNFAFFYDTVIINVRGFYFTHITFGYNNLTLLLTLLLALILTFWSHKRHQAFRENTGTRSRWHYMTYAILPILLFSVWGLQDFKIMMEPPIAGRFNVTGGVRIIPEFMALTLALSIYTAGFIAEIIRAGILSVSQGQTEAAQTLGLKYGQIYRFILIPQALRVIIPPLTSQYLNLTKNSSLAVAVGYPDLTAVFAGTALNQTGHAIEIILLTMLTYLSLSLLTAFFMNWYNRQIQLVGKS